MTTHISSNALGLAQQGGIYIATLRTGSIVSDNPQELIETIQKADEAEQQRLFRDVVTWTFVRSKHAEHYETWLKIKNAHQRSNPTGPVSWNGFLNLGINVVTQETKDAADWIEQNAKKKVQAWVIPGTSLWYWIFEDAQEAVHFRLAVTI